MRVQPSIMPLPEPQEHRDADGGRKRATLLQVVSAVFWSFFGVRKRGQLADDAASIKPQHFIVAGVVGAAVFVLLLIVIVRIVIANAT